MGDDRDHDPLPASPGASATAGSNPADPSRPRSRRPWRGWLTEIGVIVVGVLVALAGQQLVEWLQWQERADGARRSLRSEIGTNYRHAAERIVVTPCLNAQLDRLRAAVLDAGTHLSPQPVHQAVGGPTVFRHPSRLWTDAAWQGAISEDVTSHLDPTERGRLADVYASIARTRAWNNEEAIEASFLALGSPLPLDPSLRGHLIEQIDRERLRANIMALLARQQMNVARLVFPDIRDEFRGASWKDNMGNPLGTPHFCRTSGYPLAPPPE